MPPEDNLASLLSLIALRDRVAFERLYRATCAHLYGVALRILRSEGRADEILQEAYMSVWHNAAGYNPGTAAPMTWMINIVRNRAIDALRSGKTEGALTSELDDEALNVPGDSALEPQRLLDDGLVRARLDGCMGTLLPAQRQALALAYYRGMVHTEIAAALNTPLGTVKGWIRRALDQLRECLDARGVGSA